MMDMKAINRHECVQLFCHLYGNYMDFCDAYRSYKDKSGKYAPVSQVDRDRFEALMIHKVEFLCGSFYVNGENPGMLPHPIRVAVCLKNGIDIRPTLAQLGKENFIDRVRAKCATLGITL